MNRSSSAVVPFGEAPIRGEDHGAPLMAGVDELEEQISAAGDDRQVADLVDDQKRGAPQMTWSLRRLSGPEAELQLAEHSR